MDGADLASKAISLLDVVGLSWIWVLCFAVWGGTASYIARVRRTKIPFSFVELIGEWTISGFAGVVTGYFCLSANFPPYLTMAFAGISGHMGGRAIAMLEQRVGNWLSPGKVDEDRPE